MYTRSFTFFLHIQLLFLIFLNNEAAVKRQLCPLLLSHDYLFVGETFLSWLPGIDEDLLVENREYVAELVEEEGVEAAVEYVWDCCAKERSNVGCLEYSEAHGEASRGCVIPLKSFDVCCSGCARRFFALSFNFSHRSRYLFIRACCFSPCIFNCWFSSSNSLMRATYEHNVILFILASYLLCSTYIDQRNCDNQLRYPKQQPKPSFHSNHGSA